MPEKLLPPIRDFLAPMNDDHVVPGAAAGDDVAIRGSVVVLEIAERLVREDDAPAEGVARRITLVEEICRDGSACFIRMAK